MREWIEFTGKTVEEALTEACVQFGTTSENVEYEVIEKESAGLFGLNKKPARIKAALKASKDENVVDFLKTVLEKMGISTELSAEFNEEEKTLNVNILGEDMGVLIGKRGQTLDSLQYLASLVLNKNSEEYIKVKLDTENYRERRKETLENLAKNIAFKVKKTRKSIALEPMNPYERRIIHSALQNDKYVETHSEGEDAQRRVIVSLKKGVFENRREYSGRSYGNRGGYNKGGYNKGGYNKGGYNKGGYNKGGYRKPYGSSFNNTSNNTVANPVEKTEE